MTLDLDEHGRPEPPLDGDEWETLTGFLNYQRATFAWKSANLTPARCSQRLPPSSMTMGGLMKHLAYVEDDSVWAMAPGRATPRALGVGGLGKGHPDWELDSAKRPTTQTQSAHFGRSRSPALAPRPRAPSRQGVLATRRVASWPDGRAPSLRWVITHMIEEYARHNGHADLLRESLDGQVGE